MRLKKKMLGIWLKVLIIFYANDMVLLSEKLGDLQNQLNSILLYCKKKKKVNSVEKVKYEKSLFYNEEKLYVFDAMKSS